MNNPELSQFFKALTHRFPKETHLSDFTFTALEIIPGFKEDFVHFFFPNLETTNQDIEVTRESPLPSGEGQPDLVFRCGLWDLIIENKLWDTNYHFDQYGLTPLESGKAVPFVGLIANHHVTVPTKWKFRHWAVFYDDFKQRDYGQFSAVFTAYLQYVKGICAMTEFKNFKFDSNSLVALAHFVRMVYRAIEQNSSEKYSLSIKEEKKWGFGDVWAGYWFVLKSDDKTKTLSLWFGIVFDPEAESPAIVIGLHEEQNANHFSQIVKKTQSSSIFKTNYRKDDGILDLSMPLDRFDALNNEPSRENQLSQLSTFLTACCDALLKAIV